jgi:hypothetical protein
MTTNQRFVLNEKEHVVDTLNPTCEPISGHRWEGDPEDYVNLRMVVLRHRLAKLVDRLMQPSGAKDHKFWWVLVETIRASHLHTFAPVLSIQNKFDGVLKRENAGVRDITSLSLFVDDVQRLLRDLYGDVESGAVETLESAVYRITEGFMQYLCKDIYEEHHNAIAWDWGNGIGMPEGCGISGSEHRRGTQALRALQARAREVRKNPADFSAYTVEFVKHFADRYIIDETEFALDDELIDGELPF